MAAKEIGRERERERERETNLERERARCCRSELRFFPFGLIPQKKNVVFFSDFASKIKKKKKN